MKTKLIIFFLAIFSLSFSQNDLRKKIDKYIVDIDKSVKAKKLQTKKLDRMSHVGGAVTGYYKGNKLILIKTSFNAEFGFRAYSYYIQNDSLVCVKEKALFVKEPKDEKELEEYNKTHTDKNGNVDYSKLPIETEDDSVYYFKNNVMIAYNANNYNSPSYNWTESKSLKNDQLLENFKTHVNELK